MEGKQEAKVTKEAVNKKSGKFDEEKFLSRSLLFFFSIFHSLLIAYIYLSSSHVTKL